ncbi:MAG: SOS response-associated peptidase [Gemmatimonadota bacterium]|nr:MAG: SOS response-associated peptidase [Gemmatimonadota bacterium]
MCGRFSQSQIAELDREIFKLLSVPTLPPRYNVAPTQEVAVVRQGGDDAERSVGLLRWGLIPHWAKDPGIGNRMINARAESVADKPAFRNSFRERRCLVPADGFYEWAKTKHGKQPYYVRVLGGRMFAFAGLWDTWRDSTGNTLDTFTIITTEPNDLLRQVHNRMPVILRPDDYDRWLAPPGGDPAGLSGLLKPYPAEQMSYYPVSRYVNSPNNEGPECIRPAEEAAAEPGGADGTQGTLL